MISISHKADKCNDKSRNTDKLLVLVGATRSSSINYDITMRLPLGVGVGRGRNFYGA